MNDHLLLVLLDEFFVDLFVDLMILDNWAQNSQNGLPIE